MNCTCILAHQNTTAEENVPGAGAVRGGGALKASTIFVGGGGAFFCVFFNLWAVGFCENIYFYAGGGPSPKMQFCGYPLVKWDLLE